MARAANTKDKDARRVEERITQLRRQEERRRARRNRTLFKIIGGVVAAVAIASAFVFALRSQGGSTGTVVAASLGGPTNDLPGHAGGNFTPIHQTVRSTGKPEILFVGTQFCSFCAAERWAIVKALGQFGTWTNVHRATQGGSTAGFSAVPTFDLTNSGYHSKYVAFDGKDLQDYNGNTLQTLNSEEQALWQQYDPQGSTPMVLVADHVRLGAGYSPGDIDGQSFATVQNALQHGSSSTFVPEINAEANAITAILCHADGMQPKSACGRPAIVQAVANLK